MRLKLSYRGCTVIVTSELAARRWARARLGAARLTETPTETGWQYWPARDPSGSAEPVTAVVL